MKIVLTLLVAGTMLASATFARDFAFEERFRAKVGRYTFTEETRRSGEAPAVACCQRSDHRHAAAVVNSWVAAKTGISLRNSRENCSHEAAGNNVRADANWQQAKTGYSMNTTESAKQVHSVPCCD